MSPSRKKELARVSALLMLLIPLALCSCSVLPNREAVKDRGHALVEGGFEAVEDYLNTPRGQATIARATEATLEAGASKVEAKVDDLVKSLDPKIGPIGVAIASVGVELAKPYIGEAVEKSVDKIEAKRDELQAKKDAGIATPWEGISLAVMNAILMGYAAYQKGHRSGEDKGWKDAGGTGDGGPPKG